MQRTTFKIRIWTTLAVAAASLAVASSASASLYTGDVGGSSVTPQTPVVTKPDGFNWADAAIGAAIALAAMLAAIGLAYLARNRSRLAASH